MTKANKMTNKKAGNTTENKKRSNTGKTFKQNIQKSLHPLTFC